MKLLQRKDYHIFILVLASQLGMILAHSNQSTSTNTSQVDDETRPGNKTAWPWPNLRLPGATGNKFNVFAFPTDLPFICSRAFWYLMVYGVVSAHLTLGFISLVVNALSMVVHMKKTMQLSTILVSLCLADILQGGIHVLASCWDLVYPFNQAVIYLLTQQTFFTVWLASMYMFYLERVSQALTAIMCLDRFLVLSNPLGTTSIIHRKSKSFIIAIWMLIFVMTIFDGYGLLVAIKDPPNMYCFSFYPPMNFSIFQSNFTNPFVNRIIQMNKTAPNESVTFGGPLQPGFNWPAPRERTLWIQIASVLPMAFDFVMYLLLLVVIILNIATHILLFWRAKQRRWLTKGNNEKQQSSIILVMTSIYAVLALPTTTLKLLTDLHKLQLIDLNELMMVLSSVMRVGAVCDQVKNSSDFFVFLFMSRMFQHSLKVTFCGGKGPGRRESSKTVSQSISN